LGRGATILVVDDEISIRKTLAAILEEEGYTVDTAENAKEAIEKSNSRFYNLALVDIRLPDMEGTKLLAAMKETTPKMVKIIVTGYPSLENAVEAVNNRADAYVFKPVDAEKLHKTIKELLQRQQEARKYSEQKVAEFIETRAREITLAQHYSK
jgi:DNA-binding NtrC family response regulator